jgi:Tfp pilus assembly protein PilW
MTTTSTQFKLGSRAFTLVEVMIGATLGAMVLAGVLSTFLMLGRSGANVANYSTMEMESRRALEELSQDLRMASTITWSPQSITLVVPDNYTVTYAYNSGQQEFQRTIGTNTRALVKNVGSCTFARFNRLNVAIDPTVTSDATTKRIQLTLGIKKQSQTVAAASNTILSASYILRNKLVN